jgi:hypothetical protein
VPCGNPQHWWHWREETRLCARGCTFQSRPQRQGELEYPSSRSSAMTTVPSSMPKRLRNLAGTTIAPLFPTFADSILYLRVPAMLKSVCPIVRQNQFVVQDVPGRVPHEGRRWHLEETSRGKFSVRGSGSHSRSVLQRVSNVFAIDVSLSNARFSASLVSLEE